VKKHSTAINDVPSSFVTQHSESVIGVLSGFDRVRLQASLRLLYQPKMMLCYLSKVSVLLKDFSAFVTHWTDRVRLAAHQLAEQNGRPLIYLQSSSERKEALARDLARRDSIQSGLIGIWSCVEPCLTYFIKRNRDRKLLELRLEPGKCLHYYFYYQHPVLGFMHLRLQTWFPFRVNLCLNGRHWLARQMDAAGLNYLQRENCFTWIEDLPEAQALAQQQLQYHWPSLLDPLLQQCHPWAAELCRPLGLSYYWSISQSEYATDVMFKSPQALAKLYPALIHHGIKHFGSLDVLRFLGHKTPACGKVNGNFTGEILSDLKHRPEGVRLKHQANGNTLKLYDKQGSVLRVETTLNQPRQFRVYRASERDPQGQKKWQWLRKGTGDLSRRAEICQAANYRYLQALSQVGITTPLKEVAATVCSPVTRKGRRYRPLNPWSDKDGALLELISRGQWAINGFRNRDVRTHLYPKASSCMQQRRYAGRVTRLLGILRAHGLIKKVSRTHRYVITPKGRAITTALLAARQANVDQLIELAA
jgi:hypothetical protein